MIVCMTTGTGLVLAQTIEFTTVPKGYAASSIDLPRPFAGALGRDATDDLKVYATVGGFGATGLVRIDLRDGSVQSVIEGPLGNIEGIAALSAERIVLIENQDPDTILLASDLNLDGDFDDEGEIEELIAPIGLNEDLDFRGSQARVVPPGDPSGIPSGSVMFQTADNQGGGDLFVVVDPLTNPRYRPDGGVYFTGFDFNGGFDFDSFGRIVMGSLNSSFLGEVFILVNENGNETIDPGESNMIVAGENGMFDLAVDAEDNVYFTGTDPDFIAAVRTFSIPADPLNAMVTPENFAETNSGFLTGILITSKNRSFQPGTLNGATLLVGGFTLSFESPMNLLTLRPMKFSRAERWQSYE